MSCGYFLNSFENGQLDQSHEGHRMTAQFLNQFNSADGRRTGSDQVIDYDHPFPGLNAIQVGFKMLDCIFIRGQDSRGSGAGVSLSS